MWTCMNTFAKYAYIKHADAFINKHVYTDT